MNSVELEKLLMARNPELQVMYLDRDLIQPGHIGPDDYFICMGNDHVSTLIFLKLGDGLFEAHGRFDGAILPRRLLADTVAERDQDAQAEQDNPDTLVLRLRYFHTPRPYLLNNLAIDLKREIKLARKQDRLDDADKCATLYEKLKPFLGLEAGTPTWVPLPVMAARHPEPEEADVPLALAPNQEPAEMSPEDVISMLASIRPIEGAPEPEVLVVPDEETLRHLEETDQLIVPSNAPPAAPEPPTVQPVQADPIVPMEAPAS